MQEKSKEGISLPLVTILGMNQNQIHPKESGSRRLCKVMKKEEVTKKISRLKVTEGGGFSGFLPAGKFTPQSRWETCSALMGPTLISKIFRIFTGFLPFYSLRELLFWPSLPHQYQLCQTENLVVRFPLQLGTPRAFADMFPLN
jgi:hypothetical protein